MTNEPPVPALAPCLLRQRRQQSASPETGSAQEEAEEENEEGVQRLAKLASDLQSPRPISKRRTVRFDSKYLPSECNLDRLAAAVLYHNGQATSLARARRKPGQSGYQIFKPREGKIIAVDTEQPFKLVLRQQDGESFTFTGAEDQEECESDEQKLQLKNVVSLTPVKKELLLRIRMDLLLDPSEKKLSAMLLSAGKSPSPTALMRLQGLYEQEEKSTRDYVLPVLYSILKLLLVVLVGSFLKPPLDNLYMRYRISREEKLLTVVKDLVASSTIVKKEFGVPAFGGPTLFDYQVDLLSQERALFMLPFHPATAIPGRGPYPRTMEWELEDSLNLHKDDEISVTFEGEFRYGEIHVEAMQVGNSWQVSSIDVDLLRHRKNYVDTVAEWLVEHLYAAVGSRKVIQIEDGEQHLRVSIEVGHDGDRDGDADQDVHTILQEKSQLVDDKKVIGYIRPDDDLKKKRGGQNGGSG